MDVSQIQTILKLQLSQDGPQRIVIDGDWGIGKTYQIDKFINENRKSKCKIIKVSLFGRKSVEQINSIIYSYITTIFKKFFKGTLKLLSNFSSAVPYVNINVPDLSHLINNTDLKNKELLIIVDDFERRDESLQAKQVFGYIDSICSINKNLKVCLVLHSGKLSEEDKASFNDYNEKIFDKIYKVESNYQSAVVDIINEWKAKLNLEELYFEHIKDLIRKMDITNLRILSGFLNELKILINNLPNTQIVENVTRFKHIITLLMYTIYDCKTNKFFNERTKEMEEHNKKNDKGYASFEYFSEDKDELLRRTNAIASKVTDVDIPIKQQKEMIKSFIKNYFCLDGNYIQVLNDEKDESIANEDPLQVYIFYLNDQDRIIMAKKQYKALLEMDNFTGFSMDAILNGWYQCLPPGYVDNHFDLNKIIKRMIEVEKLNTYYLFQSRIDKDYFPEEHTIKVQEFYNAVKYAVYEARIKLLIGELNKVDDTKHIMSILEYINQYIHEVSVDNLIDARLANTIAKNKFYLNILKGSIDESVYRSIKKLTTMVFKHFDVKTQNKFKSTINKAISEADEDSEKQRLQRIKSIFTKN